MGFVAVIYNWHTIKVIQVLFIGSEWYLLGTEDATPYCTC